MKSSKVIKAILALDFCNEHDFPEDADEIIRLFLADASEEEEQDLEKLFIEALQNGTEQDRLSLLYAMGLLVWRNDRFHRGTIDELLKIATHSDTSHKVTFREEN